MKEDSFTLSLPVGIALCLYCYHLGICPGPGLFPSPCFVKSSQTDSKSISLQLSNWEVQLNLSSGSQPVLGYSSFKPAESLFSVCRLQWCCGRGGCPHLEHPLGKSLQGVDLCRLQTTARSGPCCNLTES